MIKRYIKQYFNNSLEYCLLTPKYNRFYLTCTKIGVCLGVLLIIPVGNLIADLCGIIPEIPVKGQEHSIYFIILFLLILPLLIIGGASFTIAMACIPQILSKKITFNEVVNLIVLSKFPHRWMMEDNFGR